MANVQLWQLFLLHEDTCIYECKCLVLLLTYNLTSNKHHHHTSIEVLVLQWCEDGVLGDRKAPVAIVGY